MNRFVWNLNIQIYQNDRKMIIKTFIKLLIFFHSYTIFMYTVYFTKSSILLFKIFSVEYSEDILNIIIILMANELKL